MSRFKNWLPPEFDDDGWAYPDADDRYQKLHSYGWRCLHPKNLKLGYGCDIGHGSLLQAKHEIEIGKNVEIAPFCYICSWSTIDNKKGKVVIKDGAKLGVRVTVMPGIIIGKNSVVGACSFVTKDIPDNVVAFGVPCKKIKDLK